jgi:YVTN family beta-propeller protein
MMKLGIGGACLGLTLLVSPIGLSQEAEFRVIKVLTVPENPHGIAFSQDGSEVYLVSTRGQAITVLDHCTDSIQRSFGLGDLPLGIALTPDGRHAAVSHFGASRISRVDLLTGEIDKTLDVGPQPSLFAVSKDTRRAFVSCEGNNRVYELSLEPFETVGWFETGERPFPPALSRDGRWLFVPSYDAGEVTVIDLLLRTVDDTIPVGKRPSGGIMLPTDKHFAVINRGSDRIDLVNTYTHEIDSVVGSGLGKEPFSMVLTPNGRLGFVNNVASATVSVLDADKLSVLSRIEVGQQPIVMAVHPSGRKLYVSCEGSHQLYVVAIPDRWVTESRDKP